MATNNSINLATPICAFAAESIADQLLVSGDGSLYEVLFPDEIFDNTNNFAASTFTAPVDGKYIFGISMCLTGLSASMDNAYILNTKIHGGSNIYTTLLRISFTNSQFPLTGYILNANCQMPMAAGDTLTNSIQIAGGLKTVNVLGSASAGFRTPYCYGYLLAEI